MVRDKYRIDAFIAEGSMATVYAATHRNGSRVALKILHRELAKDPSMAERFRREGYFANSIGHPGIVRAIDDDVSEDGCAFIVMELLEGENLEQRRERLGGRVSVPDVLHIADAMLDVLSAAHDHEVLHRDLKPENVFITRKNEVKLLDFGVARFNDGRSSSDMTAVGMVLGTPAFMPPEQALGRREDVDARSDIWAVGATLFTVMAGESVHVGGDAKTKLIATARTPARPIREVVRDLPPAIAAVIDRALAFDKAERWGNAKEMREALQVAQSALEVEGLASRLEPNSTDSMAPTVRKPADEEEPTLARVITRPPVRVTSPFDETMPRVPLGPSDTPRTRMKRQPASDGVITSAPPVTRRDDPLAVPVSEGPTFALRRVTNDQAPSTERIPPQGLIIETPTAMRVSPTAPTSVAPPITPRPAPAPVASPSTPPQPFIPGGGTAPGIGPPPQAQAQGAAAFSATAHYPSPPSSTAPPRVGTAIMQAATAGPGPSGTPHAFAAPAAYPHSSAPPAMHVSAPPVAQPITPRQAAIAPEAAPGFGRSDQPAERPRGAGRILVPIFIGLLAAAGTYVFVVRKGHLHGNPFSALPNLTAAPSTPKPHAQPSAVTSATPSPSAAPNVVPSAGPSAAAPAEEPPAPTASVAPVAASSAPPKKRRPRPKPPVTATATATATEAPPEPPPPPPPPPPPNE